jgi:hypothetical protein
MKIHPKMVLFVGKYNQVYKLTVWWDNMYVYLNTFSYNNAVLHKLSKFDLPDKNLSQGWHFLVVVIAKVVYDLKHMRSICFCPNTRLI